MSNPDTPKTTPGHPENSTPEFDPAACEAGFREMVRQDYLAELHAAARGVVDEAAGYEWFAVNRAALNKLRRLLDGDAP